DATSRETVERRRRRRELAVRQEHPAGEELVARLARLRREPVREVAEARVDEHLPVRIEAGRMQADAALEGPIHADPWRPGIPPIPVHILEGVAVPGTVDESAGLIGDRII